MEFKSADRVQIESESTERPPRIGVVEEVVHGTAHPRYRIRWDEGHQSIYHQRRARCDLPSRRRARGHAGFLTSAGVERGFRGPKAISNM